MRLTKRLAATCPCLGDEQEPHGRLCYSYVIGSHGRAGAAGILVGRYALAYWWWVSSGGRLRPGWPDVMSPLVTGGNIDFKFEMIGVSNDFQMDYLRSQNGVTIINLLSS